MTGEYSKKDWHTLFLICLVTSVTFTIGAVVALIAALVTASIPVVILCVALIVNAFAVALAAIKAGQNSV